MSEREHCADEHCVTCGDVAESMRVLEVAAGDSLAVCLSPSGEQLTVETALVAPVAVGDELLVHAGTAIAEVPATPTPPDAGAASETRGVAAGNGFHAGAEAAAG